MIDPHTHTGPVFGTWYGGSGYSFGDPATDGERFESVEDAKEALVDRYNSGGGRTVRFEYVNREAESTLVPAVDESSMIDLVLALPEGGDFTDVYPDLRIALEVDEDGEASAVVENC